MHSTAPRGRAAVILPPHARSRRKRIVVIVFRGDQAVTNRL